MVYICVDCTSYAAATPVTDYDLLWFDVSSLFARRLLRQGYLAHYLKFLATHYLGLHYFLPYSVPEYKTIVNNKTLLWRIGDDGIDNAVFLCFVSGQPLV